MHQRRLAFEQARDRQALAVHAAHEVLEGKTVTHAISGHRRKRDLLLRTQVLARGRRSEEMAPFGGISSHLKMRGP